MPECWFEKERFGYQISTDPAKLDIGVIHGFLANSYWSPGIPLAILEKAVEGSLCFGLYREGTQIGFARVITDRATFAYLCDVHILEPHRGQGLGTWLIEVVLSHPELQGLRRMVLITRDAHPIYQKFGFQALARPEGYMEIHCPNIYQVKGIDPKADPK